MVMDWATEHIDELRKNWELSIKNEPLRKIEPLL